MNPEIPKEEIAARARLESIYFELISGDVQPTPEELEAFFEATSNEEYKELMRESFEAGDADTMRSFTEIWRTAKMLEGHEEEIRLIFDTFPHLINEAGGHNGRSSAHELYNKIKFYYHFYKGLGV